MKVLVLGSHCDDIELGCGGTLHKRQKAWEITCVTFTQHTAAHPNIHQTSREALSSLGVNDIRYYNFKDGFHYLERQALWETIHNLDIELKPDLVLTQAADTHQDHTALWQESLRNFRKSSLIAYRSTIHTHSKFSPTVFEPLNQSDVAAKLTAIEKYEMYLGKNYIQTESLVAILQIAGLQIDVKYAEEFEAVRLINQ